MQPIILEALGMVIISGLLIWSLKRQGNMLITLVRLETRMEAFGDMKTDIKDHEKRLTLVEPVAHASHRRLDKIGGGNGSVQSSRESEKSS